MARLAIATTTTARLALLLVVQNQLQHVVGELWEFETHGPELWLCLVAQAEGASGPESGDGLADGAVFGVGLFVDVAGICELALGGGGGAVDLGMREGFEGRKLETVGKCVDARVYEETEAVVVGGWKARVLLEWGIARGRRLLGEVFASVEVLDDGAHGVRVNVGHDDLTRLALC